MSDNVLSLRKIIGTAYDDFWYDQHEFRILKGSRGSGKSKITALNLIYRMMNYPDANALVARRYYNTLRNSCYADLLWAINRFGVDDLWARTTAPLQITYKPTGQVILFGGMDNVDSITSIAVTRGVLCWCWIEEAFQIGNEADFNKLYFSIRGALPDGYFKQITLTFNPWSADTWLKTRFFDTEVDVAGVMRKQDLSNVFTKTTTYKDNYFLSKTDREAYEILRITNPRAAKVICDGEWGVAEGLIYTDWEVRDFDIYDVLRTNKNARTAFGLDFGFSISYNAFGVFVVDMVRRTIWVWDEMYERGQSNLEIAKRITEMGYAKETIWGDSASPKDIYSLKTGSGCVEEVYDNDGNITIVKYSLPNIRPVLKGPDSVNMGIKQIQSFHIIVHPRCKNFETELLNYIWALDKDGKPTEKPEDDYSHCLTADTIITTMCGDLPISEVCNDDMVLTHLGFKRVISAGVTQPRAEIYRLTLQDGTHLEGTGNHPIMTTHGIKYIKDISSGNEVIKCVLNSEDPIDHVAKIASNLMESYGIGTQMPSGGQIGHITNSDTDTCIDICGNIITAQSQRDITSITSTETPGTTTSPISECLRSVNTGANTHTRKPVLSSQENNSQTIKTNADSGTHHPKDSSGTANTESQSQKTERKTHSHVCIAEEHIKPIPLGSINSVQITANPHTVANRELTTRTEFVKDVVKRSSQTNMRAPCFAVVPVLNVSKTDRVEVVYDLTVEDAHDFFANGILVLNCMDSLRYGMTQFFTGARGKVVEAKGGSQNVTPTYKSRRVIPTIIK